MNGVDATARPRVTLVVPVRNEGAGLDACLASLTMQTYPPDKLEILVVDGASTDDTESRSEAWASRDHRIRVLHNPEQVMPAGLNLGIVNASGSIVGVISGHSRIEPDYVERAVQALDETGAWSVGGRIEREAGTPMQKAIAIATSSPLGVGDARHNYALTPQCVDAVFPGIWPREVFDRIGLFDPAMVANEDNELSHRIRLAGGRIWYDPEIVVRYEPRASLRALFGQYRRYGLGKVLVFRKHHGGLRWRHLVPAAWMVWMAGGLVLAIAWPAGRVIWAAGILAYAVLVSLGSLGLSRRGGRPHLIAASLVTLHAAYGTGTWQGILRAFAGR